MASTVGTNHLFLGCRTARGDSGECKPIATCQFDEDIDANSRKCSKSGEICCKTIEGNNDARFQALKRAGNKPKTKPPKASSDILNIIKKAKQESQFGLKEDDLLGEFDTFDTPHLSFNRPSFAAQAVGKKGKEFKDIANSVEKVKGFGLRSGTLEDDFPELCAYSEEIECDKWDKFRQIDGSCNNLKNPYYGKTATPFQRLLAPDYKSAGSFRLAKSGNNLPNSR